jgi:spore coat polysaccharide biosynthesis protein SpsF
VAIIQARCGSTRLPRKVLAPILDRPMLWWPVTRVRAARLVDEVVVATTTRSEDDELEALCRTERWPCFRGSEMDVLDRYHGAAREYGADLVVRITSDCPLIDPDVIDLVIATFMAGVPAVDYASNCQRRTYPRGLDTEVFSEGALERAWREDKRPEWREHVTPYIYRTRGFALADVANRTDFSALRWTVDTPKDLEFVRTIYRHFGQVTFRWKDVLRAMAENPAWSEINANSRQKEAP